MSRLGHLDWLALSQYFCLCFPVWRQPANARLWSHKATCQSTKNNASKFVSDHIQRRQLYPNKAFCLTWNQLWHPNAPLCAARSRWAEGKGRDLEVSTGIHNVSFLSLFVFSFTPEGLRFTWTRQQRHATLNLRSLPRRLLALSPPESANDRRCLRGSNLLRSGETYLPNPRWLLRIVDLTGKISAPCQGVR